MKRFILLNILALSLLPACVNAQPKPATLPAVETATINQRYAQLEQEVSATLGESQPPLLQRFLARLEANRLQALKATAVAKNRHAINQHYNTLIKQTRKKLRKQPPLKLYTTIMVLERQRDQALYKMAPEIEAKQPPPLLNELTKRIITPHPAPITVPANNPPIVINPQTGQLLNPLAGGVIDPTTGVFAPRVSGGYINPQTGQFIPAP